MSYYRSIECGDIDGKRNSEKLPGALAADQDFFYFKGSNDPYFLNMSVGAFVKSSFKQDYDNNIFVDENGAVVDAYNFKSLSEEEVEKTIETIISEKQSEFPDYEFVMVPSEFPIDVNSNEEPIMSTHVLYIKNYEDVLAQSENKKAK